MPCVKLQGMSAASSSAALGADGGVGASLLAVLPEPSVALATAFIAIILLGTALYVYVLRNASFGKSNP